LIPSQDFHFTDRRARVSLTSSPSLPPQYMGALHVYTYPRGTTPSPTPINIYIRIHAPRRDRRSDCFILYARVYSIRPSNKVPGFLNVFIVLSNSVRARHSSHLISYLPIGRQYINSRIRLSRGHTGCTIYSPPAGLIYI